MPAGSELILGGQRSGKSRRAEMLARDWLAQSLAHKAVLIATATAWDDEMADRIAAISKTAQAASLGCKLSKSRLN